MSETNYYKEETGGRSASNNLFSRNSIELNVNEHLTANSGQQIIFCGNPSVASQLSSSHNITLVYGGEKPRYQIADTYPAINKVFKSDVLDFIFFNAAPYLVIASDTTMLWNHAFQLDKLVKAIERNRYEVAILEFIDEESFEQNLSPNKRGLFAKESVTRQLKKMLPKYDVQITCTTSATIPCYTVVIKKRASR
ncbi:hypothetical protein [Vibrio sp. HN007]|uniref:hypothetical protein n=1 Tax=Vibrio iocasae TaxID=3098914 RepID=UPI0035D4673A